MHSDNLQSAICNLQSAICGGILRHSAADAEGRTMQTMTTDEYRAFLLARPRTAKLATVRADGRPHIAPIWFDLDGDVLVFNTGDTTVKAANMRRDPRVSLCIDDDRPPFAFV